MRCAVLLALLLSPALANSQSIRIAAWNLGQGDSLESVQQGLASARLSEQCDILVLQETQTDEGEDLADTIASERGWSWFGNASNGIVSRWPVVRSGTATIGVQRTRELPWAEVETPLGIVRVYSVHLTFRDGGWPFEESLRFQEITWILYHLEKTEPPADAATPVILAGDFNTVGKLLWGHQDEKGLRLLASRGFKPAPGDGATHLAFGRLDWIFVRGLHPAAGGVGELSGSDHRWVWASLERTEKAGTAAIQVHGVALVWPAALALLALGGAAFLVRRRRHPD